MRALKLFLTCLAAATLAGCAGYRLGPVGGGEAGAKSVEVLPFNNQTLQPRLGDTLTQALRERLQVDATYKLAAADAGEGTGEILKILNYAQSPNPSRAKVAEMLQKTAKLLRKNAMFRPVGPFADMSSDSILVWMPMELWGFLPDVQKAITRVEGSLQYIENVMIDFFAESGYQVDSEGVFIHPSGLKKMSTNI